MSTMLKNGKQTEINKIANRILGKKYAELGINVCEIGRAFYDLALFKNCAKVWQGYAHRHKRGWYKTRPEALAQVSQTVRACNSCHDVIEHNRELTEKIFKVLRPEGTAEPEVKIMKKTKEKLTSKKAAWAVRHQCKHCKATVSTLLCSNCGKISI